MPVVEAAQAMMFGWVAGAKPQWERCQPLCQASPSPCTLRPDLLSALGAPWEPRTFPGLLLPAPSWPALR